MSKLQQNTFWIAVHECVCACVPVRECVCVHCLARGVAHAQLQSAHIQAQSKPTDCQINKQLQQLHGTNGMSKDLVRVHTRVCV